MTRIDKHGLPDHDGSDVDITTNDGRIIGRMVFDKNTSRLEYADGQSPHRRWPLKKKYRAR